MPRQSGIKEYAIKKTINGLIFVLPSVSDEKLLSFAHPMAAGPGVRGFPDLTDQEPPAGVA